MVISHAFLIKNCSLLMVDLRVHFVLGFVFFSPTGGFSHILSTASPITLNDCTCHCTTTYMIYIQDHNIS